MTIKAIAIDDEPLALKVISAYANEIDSLDLKKTFTSQNEALKYLNKFPVDLIFLDIEMPNKTGFEFYNSLKIKPQLVFVTAYSEYALEGFNINATDYLLKPISKERFQIAIEKVKKSLTIDKNINLNDDNYISIRADYKLHKINIDEILLIEGLDDYIKIHLTNATKIVTRYTMKAFLEILPINYFIRVHRTYIVPINKIKSISNKTIEIGDLIIPIGHTYKTLLNNLTKK
ncbi:Two component transcriptional regulator, LytTR family [Flavobacterium sp. 9AF]|uniref:LytR/AlgR family response regulator transcription factor n=1 Tax=Flavobacterium sp. 9AF TaxID=2653142 RepID=UPI0012F00725|nr:LytTR family DNA-binding domain-containing protein [Flavobacterium sp. 9AF]VXB73904.1 Two component transcriptional regulator, LytTR family [Flavobacterium sp. 9AF]